MRIILFTFMFSFFSGGVVNAQQSLFRAQAIISPQVDSDNTVTFRPQAPNARNVQLSGD